MNKYFQTFSRLWLQTVTSRWWRWRDGGRLVRIYRASDDETVLCVCGRECICIVTVTIATAGHIPIRHCHYHFFTDPLTVARLHRISISIPISSIRFTRCLSSSDLFRWHSVLSQCTVVAITNTKFFLRFDSSLNIVWLSDKLSVYINEERWSSPCCILW